MVSSSKHRRRTHLTRIAILGIVLTAWTSAAVLPVVVCDAGGGRLTVELALEPCCPHASPVEEGMAFLSVVNGDCEGCTDRPLSSMGSWSRPALDHLPDAPTAIALDPVPLAVSLVTVTCKEASDRHGPEPPEERARILLPLIC